MKAEWAGIQVITDHRFVVRHAYGNEILVTNLEKFENFIGKHNAQRIMARVHDLALGYMNRDEVHIKDALVKANEWGAWCITDGVGAYMPYTYVFEDREAYDWSAVIATIDCKEHFICTVSHQAEGEDDRLHIDFYCEEQ